MQENGDWASLLGQSQPAHQVLVPGIGTYGVERGKANGEEQFNAFDGERFFQVLERLATVPGEHVTQSDIGGIAFFLLNSCRSTRPGP